MFDNLITLEPTHRSRGVYIDHRWYDANALAKLALFQYAEGGRPTLPHSRAHMTNENLAELGRHRTNREAWWPDSFESPRASPRASRSVSRSVSLSPSPPARPPAPPARPAPPIVNPPDPRLAPRGQSPELPRVNAPPLYLRRHLASGGYKFFRVQPHPRGGVRVDQLRDDTWTLRAGRVPQGEWSHSVLTTNADAPVDFSTDFMMPDQGHWVRVRYQAHPPNQPRPLGPITERFRVSSSHQFMAGLGALLPHIALGIVPFQYWPQHRRRS
jgi:hypothetical protein